MSLSDLAALGSFISGFAVLISLIFLYFQLRQINAQVLQTEKNQRALMNQGIVTRNSDILMWNTEPHINDIGTKIISGEPAFTPQEINQLRFYLRLRLISLQDVYVQHRSGLTDQMTFDNSLGAIRTQLALPVYRAIWKRHRLTYAPDWMAYIDKVIEETPLAKPADVVAQFNADLAEVMR